MEWTPGFVYTSCFENITFYFSIEYKLLFFTWCSWFNQYLKQEIIKIQVKVQITYTLDNSDN